MSKLIKITI